MACNIRETDTHLVKVYIRTSYIILSCNIVKHTTSILWLLLVQLTAIGAGRCTVNNGGCWSDIRDGQRFSACSVECCFFKFLFCKSVYDFVFLIWLIFVLQISNLTGCTCPQGFRGDGQNCEGEIFCSHVQSRILAFVWNFSYTSLIHFQISKSARTVQHVNVMGVHAKTLMVDIIANAKGTNCI